MLESAPTEAYEQMFESEQLFMPPTESDTFMFKGQLVRAYIQPKTAADGIEVTGGEVLLRSVTGLHTPMRLIEEGERDGEIHQVTLFNLRFAAGQVSQWMEEGCAVPLSVNVAASELTSGFVDEVRAILEEANVAPEYLTLELVERQRIDEQHFETLRALSTLGVRLSIDDFGSAFADMQMLERLSAEHINVDEVKIDRSLLIHERAESTARELFARGVRRVVCEGVEQLSRVAWALKSGLVPQGAAFAVQGYSVGKAMRNDVFFERMRAGREYSGR